MREIQRIRAQQDVLRYIYYKLPETCTTARGHIVDHVDELEGQVDELVGRVERGCRND